MSATHTAKASRARASIAGSKDLTAVRAAPGEKKILVCEVACEIQLDG
jgi:hypothetical protein